MFVASQAVVRRYICAWPLPGTTNNNNPRAGRAGGGVCGKAERSLAARPIVQQIREVEGLKGTPFCHLKSCLHFIHRRLQSQRQNTAATSGGLQRHHTAMQPLPMQPWLCNRWRGAHPSTPTTA